MNDVFHEVEEELRRDKAAAFLNRHGSKFVSLAIAVIVFVGAGRYYQDYRQNQRIETSFRFDRAMEEMAQGKDAALRALAQQKDNTSYANLARFRLAGELIEKIQTDEDRANAVSVLDTLSEDQKLEQEWRDIARLKAVSLRVGFAPFAEIEQRTAPIIAQKSSFRHSANELLALAAWHENLHEKALDYLTYLVVDRETPASIRSRAEALLAVVRSGRPSGG